MNTRIIVKLDVKPPYVVKPVHFETRNQLRDYKRKHNLQLGAMPYD